MVSSSGKYTVGAYLSSNNVTTGFYFREWGVFAQDPDLGEILYCYGNVGAGAEYIAAGGGSDAVEKQLDAITIIGNAANVSAVLDESLVFPSRREFEEHKEAEVLDHPDGSVKTAKLANGAATDDKIGNRTISDSTPPTSNTGKLTGLLSGLANMIKSITGGSTWRTAPGMTIAAIKTILDAATNAATANTLIKRDANGRAKVAAPSATDDIARKAEVDAAISTAAADATSKANAAQSAAISAAASDATSKANAAQAAAISAAASDATSKVNAHASDTIKHITASERTNWNAKETTTGAQAKANAVQTNLNTHTDNSTVHITAAERTAWNTKPNKDGTLQENLNSEMVNGWRVFTGASAIGLNDTATMQQIFDALPDKSKFFMNVFSSNMGGLGLPHSGNLEVTRISSSRGFALYYSVNGVFMRGNFNGNGSWAGWDEIAELDSPTFTGTPTTTEPPAEDDSSRISTTAFAKARAIAANHPVISAKVPSDPPSSYPNGRSVFTIGSSASSGNWPIGYALVETVKAGPNRIYQIMYPTQAGYAESIQFRNQTTTVSDEWSNWLEIPSLNSPNFKGTPTAPTANINTKNNQIANTEFVNSYAVNSVASGSSSDPNTTQESYILTNHGNGPGGGLYWHIYTMFYSNKTANRAQIAVSYNNPTSALLRIRQCFSGSWTDWKDMAPLDSPNFSGNVRVPTAATGSNDTTAANTSFVQKTVDNANSIKAIDNRTVRPNNLKDDSLAHYFSTLGGMTGSANTSYVDILALNGYHDTSGQKVNALVFAKGNQAIYHYQGTYGSTTWGSPKTLAYTDAIPEIATEAEAEAGADNTAMMTPWRVKQAIDNRTRYGTTTGSATAYVLTLSPAPSKLYSGMDVKVKLHTNTGTNPTLNVNGLGAKALYASNGTDRFQGVAGRIYTFIYDGTAFILASGGGWGTGDVVPLDKIAIETGNVATEVWANTEVVSGNDVAVDSSGNVYSAHISGKQIRKLNSLGEEVWANTDVGSGNAVAVDTSGNVYAANGVLVGSKSVRKLSSSGSEIWAKTDAGVANDITVDSSGTVYVAHSSSKQIRKLNSSGTELWAKTDVDSGQGVAVDSSGNVYCANSVALGGKAVRKLNSSGTEVWAKTDVANARSIAVDSSGNVYTAHNVTTGNKVLRKLDPSGSEIWAITNSSSFDAVTADDAGYAYAVSGTSGAQVRKFGRDGTEVWRNGGMTLGKGVAVDSSGNVYTAHSGTTAGAKYVRKLSQNVLGYKVL
ncbi:hypothetical protein [Paenibacillus camelliae]|uniref:hypothetical protein n=1 Tax=Paenibacillus camelliae TaxID=512410 RepID=UPI00203CA010|nr:hypothetical protein [Paenibacillus camelliae]MCM3632923.1 hypothetical protein [Paenibacillus camelliae]